MIYSLGDDRVRILGDRWFIAESASVIGNVTLHDQVSVWFNAVIRGDNDPIEIGSGSNVQDGAVLHSDPGFPLQLGNRVTVGHKAMVHGCTVGDNTLIGINSVILNGAVIGKNCIVGANALITEGKVFEDGCLIIGAPARVARHLNDEQIADMARYADSYIAKIDRYRHGLAQQSAP